MHLQNTLYTYFFEIYIFRLYRSNFSQYSTESNKVDLVRYLTFFEEAVSVKKVNLSFDVSQLVNL